MDPWFPTSSETFSLILYYLRNAISAKVKRNTVSAQHRENTTQTSPRINETASALLISELSSWTLSQSESTPYPLASNRYSAWCFIGVLFHISSAFCPLPRLLCTSGHHHLISIGICYGFPSSCLICRLSFQYFPNKFICSQFWLVAVWRVSVWIFLAVFSQYGSTCSSA